MENKTGGPAFPYHQESVKFQDNDGRDNIVFTAFTGMTLRDWFAGKALEGLCGRALSVSIHVGDTPFVGKIEWKGSIQETVDAISRDINADRESLLVNGAAKASYQLADAMIAERQKENT